MVDIGGMRHPYHGLRDTFDLKDLSAKEPFGQFKQWHEEIGKLVTAKEANSVAIATATKDGIPSVRMVLLKNVDKEGFIFCTKYSSRKASELEQNPHCSLMFYWEPVKRSVRIEGTVVRISEEESETYFHSRPRVNQLSGVASCQSTVIPNKEGLNKRYEELCQTYADESKVIPMPSEWGGYRVIPTVFEFWQGQSNRLHDRLRFRRPKSGEIIDKALTMEVEDGWLLERLSP